MKRKRNLTASGKSGEIFHRTIKTSYIRCFSKGSKARKLNKKSIKTAPDSLVTLDHQGCGRPAIQLIGGVPTFQWHL
jgi:hypothetical protein